MRELLPRAGGGMGSGMCWQGAHPGISVGGVCGVARL